MLPDLDPPQGNHSWQVKAFLADQYNYCPYNKHSSFSLNKFINLFYRVELMVLSLKQVSRNLETQRLNVNIRD